MMSCLGLLLSYLRSMCRRFASVRLENLALRHQVAVYKQSSPRPKLKPADRMFWVWLSRLWSGWQQALEFVQPRTVIAWQHKRFRDDWRRLSQSGKPGRPTITKEVRELLQAMWRSNATWGSPRMGGKLRKLGITVAKSTVEKYRQRDRKPPSPTWKAFLANHVTDIVACDFFTVPTANFRITEHPTAQWTAQQIVEAFPWDTAPRYLLRDRDVIYGACFQERIRHMGTQEVKIAPRSPWQNPYCERVIGSIRGDVLDYVIVLHQRYLHRLLTTYMAYYHRFRTHLSLEMDCPTPRAIHPPELGEIIAVRDLDGLHHHDERQKAA